MSPRLDGLVAARLADRVLGTADAGFVSAEWTDPGGPADEPPRLIAPLHVHLEDDEAWYVLEGTLRFRIGEHEIEALHELPHRDPETLREHFRAHACEIIEQ